MKILLCVLTIAIGQARCGSNGNIIIGNNNNVRGNLNLHIGNNVHVVGN